MKMAGYAPEKKAKQPMSKRAKTILTVGLISFFIIIISFFSIDFITVKTYRKPPIFCVPIVEYENGSVDYYGFLYKVWKDHDPFDNETTYYLSFWLFPKFWRI